MLTYLYFDGIPERFFVVRLSSLPLRKLVLELFFIFKIKINFTSLNLHLFDDASESEFTPCNKINEPLAVYRFTGNIMTSRTALHT